MADHTMSVGHREIASTVEIRLRCTAPGCATRAFIRASPVAYGDALAGLLADFHRDQHIEVVDCVHCRDDPPPGHTCPRCGRGGTTDG